jgi:5-methyltetrahydropteroyltriglutamate--homocysteine methyltransferase
VAEGPSRRGPDHLQLALAPCVDEIADHLAEHPRPAAPVFGQVHADRLLLEYDDERSGTFDPLRLVPGDRVVVLGLITTKTSQIEPLDQIKARLGQARSAVDADRLALSPQCGFATSVAGNAITAEAQRAKLALLVRAARDFLPA